MELADKVRAIGSGGIGLVHQLAREVGLVAAIDRRVHVLKIHRPYHESDHVLNLAYNALCDGTRLEDIELRRNDEVFLDALGTERIPDPTTAGDFCRRFQEADIRSLMRAADVARLNVWARQPKKFFERATIDLDGTLVITTGECKGGMDISRSGFKIYPDSKMPKNGHIPAADKQPAIPPDGPRQLPGQGTDPGSLRANRELWIEPLEMGPSSTRYGGMDIHTRNFMDCIKSRQTPNGDVEGGHYATAACHLANISLRLGGRRLQWDADKEDFIGDREASAMLVRPYRSPWDKELRSLGFGG